MKIQVSEPDYGPNEWDFDFSFDLELSFSDYLYLGFYLVLVVPVAFVSGLVHSLFCKVAGVFNAESEQQKREKPRHGMLSMISKIF